LFWSRVVSQDRCRIQAQEFGLTKGKQRLASFLMHTSDIHAIGLQAAQGLLVTTSSTRDGFATDWHTAHIGKLAAGGAGLVFVEQSAVNVQGRITYYLWLPGHLGRCADSRSS